jgi:hypothetical protein
MATITYTIVSDNGNMNVSCNVIVSDNDIQDFIIASSIINPGLTANQILLNWVQFNMNSATGIIQNYRQSLIASPPAVNVEIIPL